MTNRRLKDLGFTPILTYPVILISFFSASIYLFAKTDFAEFLYMLLPLSIMVQICEARRIEFLKISFSGRSFMRLRILENFMVAIPFLVFLIYKEAYFIALLLGVLSVLLVSFNAKKLTSFTVPSPFFQKSFEFTAGFRRVFFVFPLVYGLACIAAWAENLNLGLFAMSIIFFVAMNFYQKLENEYFIWSHALRPKTFLLHKVKTAVLHSTLLVAPVLFLMGISFFGSAALIAVFLLAGYGFLACITLARYSSYPSELSVPNGLLIGVCLLFPPMLLVLIPYFFIKSVRRLEPLLK